MTHDWWCQRINLEMGSVEIGPFFLWAPLWTQTGSLNPCRKLLKLVHPSISSSFHSWSIWLYFNSRFWSPLLWFCLLELISVNEVMNRNFSLMWKLNQEILKIVQSDYFTLTFDKYVQLGHTRSHKLSLVDLLKEKLEPFTPQMRLFSNSVMLWVAFCWHGFTPLFPLDDCFFQDDKAPHPKGALTHLIVSREWEWCESYAETFTLTNFDSNWTFEGFSTNFLSSISTTINKTTNQEISFGKGGKSKPPVAQVELF